MQDYVDEKTMALVVKGGKITARILREAIKDFMKIEHKVKDKAHTGKQSLKSLQKSGTALTSVEINKDNIGDFEKVAKKYKIDFSLMKQENTEPPVYYVFFKAKDAEVLDAAFNEYAQKTYSIDDRKGLKETLDKVRDEKPTKKKAPKKAIEKAVKKKLEKDMVPEITR